MGSRLIFLHRPRMFPQGGRRNVAEPDIGYRFKPVGSHTRRPRATNGVTILRGDEEDACVHQLGDRPLPRKASVESTSLATVPQTDTGGNEIEGRTGEEQS